MATTLNPAAVAVFAKTPGHSPLKTRLAATIGGTAAQAVYEQSLLLMRRRMQAVAAAGTPVYWALAEAQAPALPCWQDFPAFHTGSGGLGQRLHQVYTHLRGRARRVVLIGTDCPQLAADTILQAAHGRGTTIGPATDGGFYLFAADKAISAAQWNTPQYSSAHTLAMLLAALDEQQPALLPPLTDIDDIASLARCCDEFNDDAEAQPLRDLMHRYRQD